MADDSPESKDKPKLSPLATWLVGEAFQSKQHGLTSQQWKDQVQARHRGQADWLEDVVEELKRADLWPWE